MTLRHPGKHEGFPFSFKVVMNAYFYFWSTYFQVVHSIIKTRTQCRITVITGMFKIDILAKQVPWKSVTETRREPHPHANAPQNC